MSVNPLDNSSLLTPGGNSLTLRTSIFILTGLLVTYILFLLPLFIVILFVGYQRWRKQRSGSLAVMNSHSDIFTYNMVTLELISICGSCLYCYAGYNNVPDIMMVGMCIFAIISPAQTLFHILTCVDRYLAVVQPITYLRLKQSGGVRVRNIIIGCVWLLCTVSLGVTMKFSFKFYIISSILFFIFSSVVVTFCSLAVLCALVRPGPGEAGRDRERVDQSKQRAFHAITAIMGILVSRFLTNLVFNSLLASSVISYDDYCLAMSVISLFSVPCSLVLPLLFLHRAGKLPGFSQDPGSV